MRHILSILALAAFSGVAVADVILPKGFKLVDLDYKITTDKEYPDYLFFTIIEKNVTPLKFDPKTPIIILAEDRRLRYLPCALVAVPKDAAKKFDSEKDFFAALAANKVEDAVRVDNFFYTRKQVKDTERADTLLVEFEVDRIDSKGIVLTGGKESPRRSGIWLAGLAAALGLTLGGIWLVGRTRRKV